MESAINLKNVTKQYGTFTLDHVNLEIPKGCIVGLVGENGAGKTTLLRAILQMIHLDEGEIRVNDVAGNHASSGGWDSWNWKDEVGVVLAGLGGFSQLTARELGKCMSHIYQSWDAGCYEAYLERFQIEKKKKIGKYSKGMCMKLDLAVALSHHAKLLILDEATSGLDPLVRDEILEILRDFIQDEGHTILMSTHIISDLEKIADYVAFLHEGRVQFFEEKDELLYNHGLYQCTEEEYQRLDARFVAGYRKTAFHYEVLIQNALEAQAHYPDIQLERVSLEDILIYRIKGERP